MRLGSYLFLFVCHDMELIMTPLSAFLPNFAPCFTLLKRTVVKDTGSELQNGVALMKDRLFVDTFQVMQDNGDLANCNNN